LIEEMWVLASQGLDPAAALAQEENTSIASPLGGPPGMQEAEAQLNTTPAGRFTGMEGVDNRALPPEAQGAIPRRDIDPLVEIEQLERRFRRGSSTA